MSYPCKGELVAMPVENVYGSNNLLDRDAFKQRVAHLNRAGLSMNLKGLRCLVVTPFVITAFFCRVDGKGYP